MKEAFVRPPQTYLSTLQTTLFLFSLQSQSIYFFTIPQEKIIIIMAQPRQSSLWIWLTLLALALLCAMTFHRRQLPFVKTGNLAASITGDYYMVVSPLSNDDSDSPIESDLLLETDIGDDDF